MAPKLRSSSRPSTPFDPPATATARPASAADSSRPRKLRRTGHNSRVASDPPQGSQSQPEQLTGTEEEGKPVTGWIEPPLRSPVPSYMDTPWCAMSSDSNPVLSTMRPLGSMPTAADLRKVGLEPHKPAPKVPAKQAPPPVQNGTQDAEHDGEGGGGGEERGGGKKSETPDVPVEVPAPATALASPTIELQNQDHLDTFATTPVPISDEFDVDRIKGAVEDALRKGIQTGNQAVARALLHIWQNTSKDTSTLSILDGMCRENPTRNETSAFKTAIRSAWDEFQAEDDSDDSNAQPPAMTRTHSASSVSSLSSAKSLDAETFAPGVEPTNTRSRTKGKQAKAPASKPKAKAPVPPPRRSMFPSSTEMSQQRRRAMESDPEFSDDALKEKRERLRQEIPELEIPESRVRRSLAKSSFSGRNFGSRVAADGDVVNGKESRESSEAPENRRLTSSYVPRTLSLNNSVLASLSRLFFFLSFFFLFLPYLPKEGTNML